MNNQNDEHGPESRLSRIQKAVAPFLDKDVIYHMTSSASKNVHVTKPCIKNDKPLVD